MVRPPSFDKNGVKRGAWSEDEDNKLRAYIQRYGHSNWRELPKLAGLSRCGKSCRLRWMNYLRPGVKHGNFTKEEEDIIQAIRNKHGNKWSMIAARLPGRSDNEIKNHWHAHLKNRSQRDHNNTMVNKNEEIKSFDEPAANHPKGCVVWKPNFKDQQEVEILVAVLSSESRSSCCTSESSPDSLSVTDYAVSSNIIEPAVTNLSTNETCLPDNNDGVVSSSYNMFSPDLNLDESLLSSQASFPDYILMDDVLLW